MKTTLLMLCLFAFFGTNAQTTHNLDWFMGVGSDLDLTIDEGDTVIWTWTDELPHTVENEVGSSVETFNSGILTGMGETFSYTFTVVGVNEYLCGVHGAGMMSGTITVEEGLGVDDNTINKIGLSPNPASNVLTLLLPKSITEGQIAVFDVLGKQVYTQTFEAENTLPIDVSNLNSGLYFIKVVSGGNTLTERFLKN